MASTAGRVRNKRGERRSRRATVGSNFAGRYARTPSFRRGGVWGQKCVTYYLAHMPGLGSWRKRAGKTFLAISIPQKGGVGTHFSDSYARTPSFRGAVSGGSLVAHAQRARLATALQARRGLLLLLPHEEVFFLAEAARRSFWLLPKHEKYFVLLFPHEQFF